MYAYKMIGDIKDMRNISMIYAGGGMNAEKTFSNEFIEN